MVADRFRPHLAGSGSCHVGHLGFPLAFPVQSFHRLHDWFVVSVMSTRILVIDNYDSFVYTLVGYLQQLGAETTVIRNDDVTLDEAVALAEVRDGVLLSPGPGNPAEAGVCIELIRWCAQNSKPMFGVCLGHQALAEAFGGVVAHAPELMHGKTSPVEHNGSAMFDGVPSPFTATRYHSLAAVRETIPDELEITAQTASGVVMGLAHRTAPLVGVQFHPESVLTEGGYRMLGNWLESLGMVGVAEASSELSPLIHR